MKRTQNLESRIFARIVRKKETVLLRKDFLDLAGYDQIGRALKNLADEGKIIRIGYGLYSKAKTSSLTGETIPIAPLPKLAKEALLRLGVAVLQSQAEIEYNEGRSTQIPTGRQIAVKSRVSRIIKFNGVAINYEYV
jgi:hypothetical protein